MNSRLLAFTCAVITAFSSYAPDARAERLHVAPSLGVYLGVEHYGWEEFLQSGTRLLRESGPRGTLGLSLGNANRRSSGPVYRLDGRGYYGDVNYDGQTQSGKPATAKTRYLGGLADLSGGYRFMDAFEGFGLDLLVGGGLDKWQRNIHDSRTADGQSANGTTENYRVAYVKLGVGLFRAFDHWSHYVRLGVRRSVDTREDAHFINNGVMENVVLAPGNQVSFYLRWDIDRLNQDQDRTFGVALYYESARFNQSPSVGIGSGDVVYQPDSRQDTIGVQLDYYFNPF